MTARPKLRLERVFEASPEEVWELWTTKDGVEAWMGPDGFTVTVNELDVRAGGAFVYAMTAVGPEQVEYMVKSGMPLVTTQTMRFVQVDPPRRLVYRDVADFIPGVQPYEVETVVELEPAGDRTRMVLTFDAMHDEHWTEMSRLGREMELDKLAKLLETRS
ncbi:MAG TPA: SRPBCC domain-containing protein [Candidatus Dormibacteraeota bacterium]|nr:SRPBCC domain-containing protein [Candidatus Dormibacteraeota bacterium]